MALTLYSDFIEIRQDFIPVYSEQADNTDRQAWKSFIPHHSMQNVLDTLIDALQRGKASDCRSLWIHGAYGTGKTFAAFTIKHLIEDDLDQVEDYFVQHNEIKHLWKRFSGLRKQNRPLVIYVSSSSHIDSNFKLIANIHEAVRRELRKRGAPIPVQTLRLKIIELLDNIESTFNWHKAFEKHHHKFILQYSSPDEVINKLRSDELTEEQFRLLQDVNEVLEKENLVVIDDAVSLREWLREVQEAIKEQYDSIIFIWDEFTDFFHNNVPLSGFQEMAHTTTEMPFYFIIITHRSLEIALSNAQADERKKISDRFHMLPFQMAPVTAYHLIGSALSINDKCVNEWKDYKINLLDKIMPVAGIITASDSNVELSQFEKLIPIHPYTAYLLATISRLFSSSQRTLFQFLKGDNRGTFRWFINNYPGDNNYWWLSADWLWDYFFSSETKYTDLVDRVRDVVAYASNRLSDLDDESSRRVFKAVMLLISLSRQMGSGGVSGSQSLISPRKSKIEQIFSGTQIQEKLENILNSLQENSFIYSIPISGDTEFILPMSTIDEKRKEEIKISVSSESNFRALLKSGNVLHTKLFNLFKVNDVHGERQHLVFKSCEEFLIQRENIIQENLSQSMIQVIYLVARNDISIPKVNAIANELTKKVNNNRIMILVLQNSFGDQRWKSWTDKEALRQYCQEINDNKNESYHNKMANEILDEWIDLLKNGKINAYYSNKLESLNGKIGFDSYFKQIVGHVFPYGTEQLSTVNTLYKKAGNVVYEYGLRIKPFQNPYKNLTDQFEAKGFWNETSGYKKFPNHPLSKLKEFINKYFQNNDRVYLDELWKELQKPPFGLMNTNISAFVLAMSLRDFSTGFYVSDGLSSQELNPDKLAGILPEITKENISYSNFSIHRLSQEDRDLCDILRRLFKLDSERCKYPLGAKQEVSLRLDSIGYPIWGLKYHDRFDSDEKVCESLKLLGQFLRSEANDHFGANHIKKINDGLEEVLGDGKLEQIFTSKTEYQSGFERFLKKAEPELDKIIQNLRIEYSKILEIFKNKLKKAVYLWIDQDIKDVAPETIKELMLIQSMNEFCGSKSTDIDELKQKVKKSWLSNRLPLTLWIETEEDDDIADILRHLDSFLREEDLNLEDKEILATGLSKYKDYLQKRLIDTKNTLKKFISKNFHRELDEGDIAQLISEIPDMTEGLNLAQIKHIIEDCLNKLRIILLRKELKDKWQEFTASSSPSDWSVKNGMPIRWIMKIGDEDFFNVLKNIDKAYESELKKILEIIKSHKSELEALTNEDHINDVFLKHACGDYHDIVKNADANDLKIYLKNNVSSKPDEWPQELVKFKDAVERWILNVYTQTILGEVIEKIDGAADPEIKKFMKELAEKNPRVGIEVLKNI